MGEKSAGDGEPDQGYTSNWDLGYDVRNGKEEIGEQNWQAGGERETPQNEGEGDDYDQGGFPGNLPFSNVSS
ncbi:hypothetical protein Aperf_G00000122443 [Anoplocephala perfoliata]